MAKSYVYGVRFGPYVKIGYITDPAQRLQSLRSRTGPSNLLYPADLDVSGPEPLFLLGGDYQVEHFLHMLLTPFRVTGEWYHYAGLAELLVAVRQDVRQSPEWLATVFGLKQDRCARRGPVAQVRTAAVDLYFAEMARRLAEAGGWR